MVRLCRLVATLKRHWNRTILGAARLPFSLVGRLRLPLVPGNRFCAFLERLTYTNGCTRLWRSVTTTRMLQSE